MPSQPPDDQDKSQTNHRVFRTGETAMLALESTPAPDSRMVPRIYRFYRPPHRGSTLEGGRVFGHALGTTCALLVKVTPGSLIQTVEWRPDSGHMAEGICQIGTDYEVIPIEAGKREFSRADIDTILRFSPANELGPLVLTDSDLTHLFSGGQPPWLQGIVDAQLLHDRVHNVARFYQFTPWPVNWDDIWRCVKAAPYWALARWKDRLTPYQLARCIRKSPRGAVSFATGHLPVALRKEYLEKYAADALLHAADKLTVDELLRCAAKAPRPALTPGCRQRLPPPLRATLLAGHYHLIRRGEMNEPIHDLQRDILESVVEFPAEWLAVPHHGDFSRVMGGLADHLSIRPKGTVLIEMLSRMDPTYQKAFAEYLGSSI